MKNQTAADKTGEENKKRYYEMLDNVFLAIAFILFIFSYASLIANFLIHSDFNHIAIFIILSILLGRFLLQGIHEKLL